jgi:hypothetical protein
MTPGGVVFRYDPAEDAEKDPKSGITSPLIMSVWRAWKSINVLLNKKERRSVLMRMLGPDYTETIGEVEATEPESVEATEAPGL